MRGVLRMISRKKTKKNHCLNEYFKKQLDVSHLIFFLHIKFGLLILSSILL